MPAKHKVLITDRFAIDALATLKAHPALDVVQTASHRPTADELKDAEGLVIRSRTPVDAAMLAQAPRLKVVVTSTSGFDHIDFQATSNIQVMFTPQANARSAAELTWALVLACSRRIPEAHRAVKAGDWRRDSLSGRELAGKTYGIVGLGRIGQRVARFAEAFEMKVLAFDPYQDDDVFERAKATRVGLEEILKLADIMSLHVPLTAETRHLINRQNLEYIHRGMILVNTSRGPVVHEADLCEALENGWLGAVGLDVFEKEPLDRNSNLLRYGNVVLSPHLGATTTDAFARASQEAADKIVAFFTSGATADTLPPQADWWSNAESAGFFSGKCP